MATSARLATSAGLASASGAAAIASAPTSLARALVGRPARGARTSSTAATDAGPASGCEGSALASGARCDVPKSFPTRPKKSAVRTCFELAPALMVRSPSTCPTFGFGPVAGEPNQSAERAPSRRSSSRNGEVPVSHSGTSAGGDAGRDLLAAPLPSPEEASSESGLVLLSESLAFTHHRHLELRPRFAVARLVRRCQCGR